MRADEFIRSDARLAHFSCRLFPLMGVPIRALTLTILTVTRAPLQLFPAYPRIVASRTRRAYVLSDCKSSRWRVTFRDGMAIIVGGKTQTYAAQDLWFEQAPHHPPGASFPLQAT
jgi:hypothetical protein